MKTGHFLATTALVGASVAIGVPAYGQTPVSAQTPVYAQAALPASQDKDAVTQPEDPATLGQTEVELESGQDASGTQESSGDIVVTGSRIRRPNLSSAVPITSIGVQDLTDTGDVSLGDELNQLPALRSTFSQSNSTRLIGTAGLNLLDLRGLGTERTLVLVNGRRHVTAQPGNYNVDTNTIPTDLVERVDIVTGGNSAIYGSDAVAGVVNFVLKRDFEGVRVRAQGGISDRGDRGTLFTSVTAGKNFSDGRGNIAVSFEYAKSRPLFFTDRDDLTGAISGTRGFFTTDVDIQCNAIAMGQPGAIPFCDPAVVAGTDGISDTTFFAGNPGTRSNTQGPGGGIITTCTAPLAANNPGFAANERRRAAVCTGETSPTGGNLSLSYFFEPDGSLLINRPDRDLRSIGGPVFGGRGITGGETSILQPGLDRYAGNLIGHFDISPAFKPFIEAKFVRIESLQTATPTFLGGGNTNQVFRVDNAFLTPQARATLGTILAPGATTFVFGRNNFDFGPRGEDHRRETYRIVAGVGGDITPNLRYEVAGNYGRIDTYYQTSGNIISANLNRATDAVRNAAGQIACRVNADAITTNDDPACVPLDIFGANRFSQAALDYISVVSSREQRAEQINATAFVSGDTESFFRLPGGGVGFALGVEYRKEKAFSDFDDFTQSGATFFNAIQAFDPPSQEIKEAFGEIRIPLLADRPFFQELTVEASGRASDYGGRIGTQYAYNLSGIYSPVRDLRLRAGYARSVRAPNLGNLFASRSDTFANGFVDPCNQTVINTNPNRARNCAAAGIPTTIVVNGQTRPFINTAGSGLLGFNAGNPDLVPEVGTSLTLGGVFQPSFLPGFSLTIDYYDIKVKKVIQGLNGQTIIDLCYDDPGGIDNQFCNVIFRRRSTDPLVDFTFDGQASRTFVGADTVPLPRLGPSFLNTPFNFAALKTSGVDFDAAYRRKIFGNIDLNLRAVVSWIENRETFSSITEPDRSTQFAGTLGDPEWEGTFNARLDFGQFDIGYGLQYIGRQTIGAFATQFSNQGRPPENADAFPTRYYPDVFYHDVRVAFQPNEQFEFYVGVDNIADRYPPFGLDATGAGGGIFSNTGRFFYSGARITF